MNIPNYKNYGFTIYESSVRATDQYKLGDIVINKENEIGVIIQIHSANEFRVDMFGNTSTDEVRLATQDEVNTYRPNVLNEGTFKHN
jgi:hypothetical protein